MQTSNNFTMAGFFTRLALTVLAVVAMAGAADAATLLCPLDDSGNQLEITWDGSGTVACDDWGDGSPFPNSSDDPLQSNFNGNFYDYMDDCPTGCTDVVIDELSTSGTFTILSGPGEYLLLFKFGQGNTNPDWFVIFLDNVLTGDFALLPEGEGNALSHVALWGDPGTPEIPEPASLILIGTGLFGAAAARRRRKA